MKNIKLLLFSCLLMIGGAAYAQPVDFSKAAVVASPQIQSPVRETIIRVLQEEVAARTGLKLPLLHSARRSALIALATVRDETVAGMAVPKRPGENLPGIYGKGYHYPRYVYRIPVACGEHCRIL